MGVPQGGDHRAWGGDFDANPSLIIGAIIRLLHMVLGLLIGKVSVLRLEALALGCNFVTRLNFLMFHNGLSDFMLMLAAINSFGMLS